MRKFIRIVCYIIAGFFLYAACLIGFINQPPYFIKIAIMSGFAIPGLIAIVAGLAIGRFQTWKRDVGIVLLTASGLTALVAFSVFCLFLSSEFKEFFPDIKIVFFNDYLTGLSYTILFALTGIFLIRKSKRTDL